MRYEYLSPDKTKVYEIVASMRNPPPERVLFRDQYNWEPAPDDPEIPAWTRVYGNIAVNDQRWGNKAYGVGRYDVPKGLPGFETDSQGRTIFRNKDEERAACKEHGFVRYED